MYYAERHNDVTGARLLLPLLMSACASTVGCCELMLRPQLTSEVTLDLTKLMKTEQVRVRFYLCVMCVRVCACACVCTRAVRVFVRVLCEYLPISVCDVRVCVCVRACVACCARAYSVCYVRA